MRLLIVTPQARQFGPVVASWMRAFRRLSDARPDVRFEHLRMFNEPYHGDASKEGHDRITRKYQESQEWFLFGTWDLYIALEDDIVIPEDGFLKLLDLMETCDIGYSIYNIRLDMKRWNIFSELDDGYGQSFTQTHDVHDIWGKVIDVAGVGLGFTGIWRHVLEAIPFQRRGPACNDWYLAVDAQKIGFVQQADTSIVCGHMTTEPTPRILWPDPSEERFCRVELI